MLKLLPTKDARKFLDSLPPKQFRQIMLKVLKLLEDPYQQDSEQLTGYPFWRTDIGEYRIIYDVQDDTLRLLVVGKRNDSEVYKELRNKKL
jgi:mRNA interferase RelE/StbE